MNEFDESSTQEIIHELVSQFDTESARYHHTEFSSTEIAQSSFSSMLNKSDNLVKGENLDANTARKAMILYGRCHGIVSRYKHLPDEINLIARQAQIFRVLIAPNRDEARDFGSDLLADVAERYLTANMREEAGVEFTNSALLILEMHNHTPEQLKVAHDRLIKSLALKKNPLDWAFSEFNLGICERKQAEAINFDEPLMRSAWKRVNRANRVMCKYGGIGGDPSILPINLSETIRGLYRNLQRETVIESVMQNSDNVPTNHRDSLPEGADNLASAIISNPEAFGFETPPIWTKPYVDLSSIKCELDSTRQSIDEALKTANARDGASLLWERHLLNRIFLHNTDLDQDAAKSLDMTWKSGDMELFFIRGRTLVGSSFPPELKNMYIEMLENLSRCLNMFRSNWRSVDIERLLLRNQIQFRFIACELARFNLWGSAFNLLESSRGLVTSQTLRATGDDNDRSTANCNGESITWMHVTHSPGGVAVVGMHDGNDAECNYFGSYFPEISGSLLARLFSATVAPYGLIWSQKIKDTAAIKERVDEIYKLLTPVADFIAISNLHSSARIFPGGYFQAFPIGSLLSSEGRCLAEIYSLATAPSRNISVSRQILPISTPPVNIVCADAVPNLDRLAYAEKDQAIIQSFFQTTEITATRTDLVALVPAPGQILHFTGHSYASIDPHLSGLQLYGGKLTVADILDHGPRPDYAVVSSCESGVAHNFNTQDEYLSIQSAFLYRGATISIGTLWPVTDFGALCFTSRLYWQLSQEPSLAYKNWINSFSLSQKWIREATVAELESFLGTLSIEIRIPDRVRNMSIEDHPFRSPYYWSAFSIMARV
ncbi:CHAT domain-containing protein [Rhodococcus erythropolis]|jgi:CHAT domain-containing protein|uniref:CHAT domain-containing protein n=1 Tax=Rhodococcus erythropolis TaxID=1833 RepID=UPI0009BD274E|nr:CHAT domain-containing protein [Rhodococcus erythropolis]